MSSNNISNKGAQLGGIKRPGKAADDQISEVSPVKKGKPAKQRQIHSSGKKSKHVS
jgi:hypothetical protein